MNILSNYTLHSGAKIRKIIHIRKREGARARIFDKKRQFLHNAPPLVRAGAGCNNRNYVTA